MTPRSLANIAELMFFGIIILLMCAIVLSFLSGFLYMVLKKFFGKPSEESEPGQVTKKAKKSAPAPAEAEVLSTERIEPTFGDSPALAKVTAPSLLADEEPDAEAEPDEAAVARDAAFADRMADQFNAEPVTA